MKEDQIRYIEMVQTIISRMSSNSFLLKGWALTLIVGLLAFASIEDIDSRWVIIAIIPTIFFWFLDGYFLHQERLYRKLYKHATNLENKDVDFSLDTSPYKDKVKNIFFTIFSRTLILFY